MNRLMSMLAVTFALTAAALAGCATETPYAPRVPGAHVGGYSEQKLDATHWSVRFSGNTLTSRETVERYLLYRAAELTVEQGYDWFEAADQETETHTRQVVEHDTYYGGGFGARYGWGWRPGWMYYERHGGWMAWDPWADRPFWTDSVRTYDVTRYVATAEIVMGKASNAPPAARRVLDAREVIADLESTIVRPKG